MHFTIKLVEIYVKKTIKQYLYKNENYGTLYKISRFYNEKINWIKLNGISEDEINNALTTKT